MNPGNAPGRRRRHDSLGPSLRTLSSTEATELAALVRELSAPLTAIVSNAQAARRMGGTDGGTDDGDSELAAVLSDIAEDGKRAGELLRRLDIVLSRRSD